MQFRRDATPDLPLLDPLGSPLGVLGSTLGVLGSPLFLLTVSHFYTFGFPGPFRVALGPLWFPRISFGFPLAPLGHRNDTFTVRF